MLDPKDAPGMVYFIPVPKSPHGCDVDPTGEYIVGNGKLSADLSVYSFDKIMAAIANEDFEGDIDGIPVIRFEAGLDGTLKGAGLGPLHTAYRRQRQMCIRDSQKDKDVMAIVNWKKAEEYLAEGNFKTMQTSFYHNLMDEKSGIATSNSRPQ